MDEYAGLLGWLAVVVAAILVGFIVVMTVRRWAHQEVQAEAFTFQDLRDMRARGEITEQEFKAMRDTLLAQMTDLPAASAEDDRGDARQSEG